MSEKIDKLLAKVVSKDASKNPMRIERKKRNLTLENIANLLKMSISAVGNFEAGRFPFPIIRLNELADLYEIDNQTFIKDYNEWYKG